MNRGGRCPLFPSLSLFPTNSQSGSQASRLSEGEQSDWVMSQTPVVWSHGLMLCQTPQPLALSTRFLSQQRNVLPTWAFYTFPVFFFSLSPSLSVSIFPICWFLFSSHLSLSVYSLSSAFANTCSLLLPALFKCYGGERCSHPSPPLSLSFLNCSLSEEVGFLLCAALLRHTQTSVLPLWGISIFKKANEDNYAEEHHPSSGKTLNAVWYRRAHILGECHQLALFCRLTVHLCLVGTHCCTLLWQPSSILNQILWGVCTKQLYFCSMNKLTSPQICSSQLQ